MNLVFSPEPDTNRVFWLSAVGSLLLHGIGLTILAMTPRSEPIQETPPRVQVELVQRIQEQPAPPMTPTPQAIPTPQQPRIRPSLAPPVPPSRPRAVKPVPLPPQRIQRPQPVQSTPKSVTLKKPVLQDSQSARALQARDMMKLAAPATAQHSPAPPVQQPTVPSTVPMALPPMPAITRTPPLSPIPSPPPAQRPQALQARPPASVGSGTTRPVILTSSKPLYPRVARESGWEGTVIVRTLIDDQGIPTQTEIRKSSGHPPLDQSAMEAIKTWKFRPAQDGKIPIAKWVDIPVKFDLNNR